MEAVTKLAENKNLDPQSKIIAKETHKVNRGEFEIAFKYEEFNETDLTDPKPDSVSVPVRGKVFKKMLKETIQVACIPIDRRLYDNKKLEATLAILSRLHSSDSIIKFHGTSCVNKENVLIFDWAHMGNLKYVYEEYNKENKLIPWKKKLKIAYDICLGLQFLHKCELYHCDIRCKNILVKIFIYLFIFLVIKANNNIITILTTSLLIFFFRYALLSLDYAPNISFILIYFFKGIISNCQ